ncbi:MAG: class I SAM-dependent methyltransferase [Thermoplasmata archaeon]
MNENGGRHVHHHGHHWGEDPTAFLLSLGIRSGMNVADLGSGTGFYTIPIASMVRPGGNVYAVDADKGSLAILKERADKEKALNVRVILSNIERLPFRSGTIDLVFLANVFHDIQDRKNFLSELKRVLKSSGLVVDFDWSDVSTIFGPPLSIRISEREAREEFANAGFEESSSMTVEGHHYALILKPSL